MSPSDLPLDYVQSVAAGMAQSDRCGGGKGHVRTSQVVEAIEERAKGDERVRRAVQAAGSVRRVVCEVLSSAGWVEIEAGVWTPSGAHR